MKFPSEKWSELFDKEVKGAAGYRSALARNGVQGYRCKTYRVGTQVEVEIYPIWYTGAESKKARESMSTEVQKRQNSKNARKHFGRKMNLNFTDADFRMDFTYTDDFLPSAAQAKKDMENYLRRVKYACKKQKLPNPKYMGVTEGKREGSRQKRVHHHLVISCGLARDELEAIWGKGRVRAEHLQADRYGYTALANYLMKAPESGHRYFCSRNLKEPKPTISDTKLSMRKAERLALDVEANGIEIFKKLYAGCELLECEVKHSDYVAGVYIYARLWKGDRKNERQSPSTNRKQRTVNTVPVGSTSGVQIPGVVTSLPYSERRVEKST